MSGKSHVRRCAVAGIGAAVLYLACHPDAAATNVTSLDFDARTDTLIVEIAYRGTHGNHAFSIAWGECRPLDDDRYQIYGLLLDGDENDRAIENFSAQLKVDMAAHPCRPAKVTIRTAAGFNRSIDVPARDGQ